MMRLRDPHSLFPGYDAASRFLRQDGSTVDGSAIPITFTNIFQTGDPNPGGVLDEIPAPDAPGGIPFGTTGESTGGPTLDIPAGSSLGDGTGAGELPGPSIPSGVAGDPGSGPSVMDVVDSLIGGAGRALSAVGNTVSGRGRGSSNPSAGSASGGGVASLFASIFGQHPGASGQPQTAGSGMLMLVVLGIVVLFAIRLMSRRA